MKEVTLAECKFYKLDNKVNSMRDKEIEKLNEIIGNMKELIRNHHKEKVLYQGENQKLHKEIVIQFKIALFS